MRSERHRLASSSRATPSALAALACAGDPAPLDSARTMRANYIEGDGKKKHCSSFRTPPSHQPII